MRLSDDLGRVLRRGETCTVTVQGILEEVGEKGFGLLLVVLSLPSALPVPAPGYSIPFGIILFLLGLQMAAGRTAPRLPRRLGRIELSHRATAAMESAGTKFLSKLEFFIRPRLYWIGSRAGRAVMSGLVLFMALLMCVPIPGTNTIPAIAVFLIGIGLAEEDGVFALLALGAAAAAALVYLAAFYFLITFFQEYGWDAVNQFLSMVKTFLRSLLGGESPSETVPEV
ncbi:MAG: exopolysaccharide biosynthesis protein [Opitutales bacterium]|nr:exopolysaccharide biosynthesis protein [Opitutales bacterium]